MPSRANSSWVRIMPTSEAVAIRIRFRLIVAADLLEIPFPKCFSIKKYNPTANLEIIYDLSIVTLEYY